MTCMYAVESVGTNQPVLSYSGRTICIITFSNSEIDGEALRSETDTYPHHGLPPLLLHSPLPADVIPIGSLQ